MTLLSITVLGNNLICQCICFSLKSNFVVWLVSFYQVLWKCLLMKIKDRFSFGKSISKFTSTNWQSQEYFYKVLGKQNSIKITKIRQTKSLKQEFKKKKNSHSVLKILIGQSVWLYKNKTKQNIRFEENFSTIIVTQIYIYQSISFSSIQVDFLFCPTVSIYLIKNWGKIATWIYHCFYWILEIKHKLSYNMVTCHGEFD